MSRGYVISISVLLKMMALIIDFKLYDILCRICANPKIYTTAFFTIIYLFPFDSINTFNMIILYFREEVFYKQLLKFITCLQESPCNI